MVKQTLDGFKQFILKGNVVDLAVAVIIGSAFGAVVAAMVKDLFTPLIAAIGGKPDFGNLYFTINKSKFMYGDFLNALISFLTVATVVYFFIVLPMNALMKQLNKDKKTGDPTEKKCPECLSDIPIGAKRCAFCTTVLSK